MQRYLVGLGLVFICLLSARASAQNQFSYYCDPLHAYYPTVQTCPTQWREVAAVAQPQPSQTQASGVSAIEAAFHKGLVERSAWEAWDASLTGDTRAGADYWASHRSIANPGTCAAPTGISPTPAWTAGCLESKARLDPNDIQRKSDPNYRRGWNSYNPAAVSASAQQSGAPVNILAARPGPDQAETERLAEEKRRRDAAAAQAAEKLAAAEAEKRADAEQGYKVVTIPDIRLDYDEMNESSRVIVTGYYSNLGQVAVLTQGGENRVYIDASLLPRDVRREILDCTGCYVTLWAHPGCTLTLYNQPSHAPCLIADKLKRGPYGSG